MSLSWTRRAPRHALPSRRTRRPLPEGGTPDLLLTGPFPAVTPGSVLATEDFQRTLSAPAAPADPDEETGWHVPDFAETGSLDRPYAPEPTEPPPASARLLAMADGTRSGISPLEDLPYYAGPRDDGDGQRAVAVCIGTGAFGRILFETGRIDVLDALELAARTARDALVYSGFRAPAVPADPDAAGHREVLERELDAIEAEGAARGPGLPGDSIETARAVLQAAAGNLGFISGDLKRENAEGVLSVLIARADLARAVHLGDEPVALKAAEELVNVISDLCGDEAACAIANGIVPSGEAVARAGDAPEPEAVVVSEDASADGQDGPVAA